MATNTGILSTIGDTPLVVLEHLFPASSSVFLAKLEMLNPGGSTKDRTAILMLSRALEDGLLDRDSTVIESSSGNMAIGLAMVCRYLALKLVVVTDPRVNQRTLEIIQAYGARVERVTDDDPGENYLTKRLNRVQQLQSQIRNSYWPNQYSNDLNPQAHYQTMKEIVDLCPRPPDYLIVATGTCGTIMGCARYLRDHHLKTKVVAVDALGSVIFDTSHGKRLIPGHGSGRQSELLDRSCIDRVFHMSDQECVIGCRRLLHRESILAGGSTGAVVMAAEKLQGLIPDNSHCVMIFPDNGDRYLDTIYNDAWVEETFDNIKPLIPSDSGRSDWDESMPAVAKNRPLTDHR